MTAIVVVVLSWLVFVACLNSLRWQLTTASAITLCFVGVLGVVRPTLLVAGLDAPFPNDVFAGRDVDAALVTTQLVVMLWMVVFTASARTTVWVGRPSTLTRPPNDVRVVKFVLPLAVVALALTIPVWVRYGGPSGLAAASKGRELGGTVRALRVPALLAAYLGATVASFRDPVSGTRPWARRGWTAYALGAIASYSWGSRDASVFPLIVPLVMMAARPRRLSWAAFRSAGRVVPRAAIATVLILGVGVGLRVWRDVTLTGGVQRTLTDQSIARQVSVAMNLTQFDAFMLVVDDVPSELPFAGARLATGSVAALVPFDGGSSQRFVPPAVQVARHYQPNRLNGWPLTAAGDWYFAFGVLGVLLGAIVSGQATTMIDRWRRRQPTNCSLAATAVIMIWSTTIALGGTSFTTSSRIVSIGAPVIAALMLMRLAPLRVGYGLVSANARFTPLPASPRARFRSFVQRSSNREFDVTFASMLIGLIAALSVAVIGARVLGPAQFGALSWATSTTYLASALAAFGLPLSVVAHRSRPDAADTAGRDHAAVAAAGALGLTVGLVILTVTAIAPGAVGEQFVGVARATAFLVAPTAMLAVASACFRADRRFRLAAITNEQTLRLAWLLALVCCLAISRRSATLATALAATATTGWAIAALRRISGRPRRPQPTELRTLLRASIPFFVGAIGATLIPQAGVVLLGLQRDADEVAVFSAAVRVQMLCSIIAIAATRVIGPRIARSQGSDDEMTSMMRDASTFVFATTMLIALPFLLVGGWIVPLLFGDGFDGAVAPTLILLAGLAVNTFTGSSGQLLYNSGHERWLGKRVLAGGIVFVMLCLLTGPRFGAVGVATSAAVVVAVLSVVQTRAALRTYNVRTWARTHPTELLTSCRRFLAQGATS